jgi:bifunctional UDP-N-acetylglucosamine pyrophosphorylase/glucosamine-1-phosphate N-acetyltransferase
VRPGVTMINPARLSALQAEGVTLLDPSTTFIDDGVAVGRGTIIHPGVTLEGGTRIGANCRIRSWVRITDSVIGDNVLVNDSCVIVESQVDDECHVGPFSHLRPASHMKAGSNVGNFVELKKTVFGEGSKANHLAYLGDATIGAGVNIGAGTITCNYDGEKKHPTVIEDGAFIGSDSQLIAPVKIGAGAYVGAGSSITDDVPPGALAVARGRQTNITGWVERRRRQKQEARSKKPEDGRQKTEARSQKPEDGK